MPDILMPQTFDISEIDSNQKIDLVKLTAVIDDTYTMHRSFRYSQEERDAFLEKGDKLLEQAQDVANVYFQKGVVEIAKANKEIKKSKDATNKGLQDIEKAADTVEQLGALINSLAAVINLLA